MDIKPQNIIVLADLSIRLIDFEHYLDDKTN